MHGSAPFSVGDLSILSFGIHQGVLEPIPMDPEGPLRLWAVKSYTWIFNCTGVSTPNPHVVQGSAVVVATLEKGYYIQVLEAIAINFLCKPSFMYIYIYIS